MLNIEEGTRSLPTRLMFTNVEAGTKTAVAAFKNTPCNKGVRVQHIDSVMKGNNAESRLVHQQENQALPWVQGGWAEAH